MRVLFVCAGAEPGADGVGDYSRRLAGEISRRGHPAALLALNDRPLAEESIESKGELRLSANLSWKTRLEAAKKFAAEFRPDVWSLQFVSYGFDPQGLPLGLAAKFRNLAGRARWHAMFHELWIEPTGGWTKQVLSRLQKALLVDLCRVLKPGVVHTSIPYYRERLECAGVACRELPLFGNIPVIAQEITRREDEWVFAFFGSLRPGWKTEPLLSRIEQARAAAGKSRCRFLSIGRLGHYGEKIWEQMERSGHENFVFEKRGELPSADISRELQSANFGIAVSPYHLLGKSGAVAAMREHGLPVIVNRFDSRMAQEGPACQVRGGSRKHADPALTSRALLARREEGVGEEMHILLDKNFSKNLAAAKRDPARESLPEIAEAFLNSLKNPE
jgi:hypothetical protein